jgi:lysozyme family protein
MSDFNIAYAKTGHNEGGYANNPADTTGGETVNGISRIQQPRWGGWRIIDTMKQGLLTPGPYGSSEYKAWVNHFNDLVAASDSLQGLIKNFYLLNFWGRLSEVNDQVVANALYDRFVNCGDEPKFWLQRALGVTADGIIGSGTIAATNAADGPTLLQKVNAQAKAYYDNLIERRPQDAQFKNSWYARLVNYDGTPYVS